MLIYNDLVFILFFSKKLLQDRRKVLYLHPLMRGTLAQLVEQRTENPCVPGSIPGGTTLKPGLFDRVFCF